MIRAATFADVPRMVALGREFLRAAALPIDFDAEHASRTAHGYIYHPDTLALVLEVDGRVEGVMLAHCLGHAFGPVRVAQELLWWIEPAHRGAGGGFIDRYEAWARERGAVIAGLAARDERVGRLYLRRGYALAETHYFKVFG